MLQFHEDVHFIDQLLLLLLCHSAEVRLLPDHILATGLVSDQSHFAVAALAKIFVQDLVVLHVTYQFNSN
jgi:hypothetical protein